MLSTASVFPVNEPVGILAAGQVLLPLRYRWVSTRQAVPGARSLRFKEQWSGPETPSLVFLAGGQMRRAALVGTGLPPEGAQGG